MSVRKRICNCCRFSKSTIFKKKIGKKLPSQFSMKKPFSPRKIGRFLEKKRVKNVFFNVNLSNNNKN